jgi:hypothetical protein
VFDGPVELGHTETLELGLDALGELGDGQRTEGCGFGQRFFVVDTAEVKCRLSFITQGRFRSDGFELASGVLASDLLEGIAGRAGIEEI